MATNYYTFTKRKLKTGPTLKTRNLTDFSIYHKDNEVLKHAVVPMLGVLLTKPQKGGRCIHEATDFELRCPKCKLSNYNKDGKIEGSDRQRYKCNHCHKTFSLSAKVVNIKNLFETLYDKQHEEQPYMLSSKYRKVLASKEDARYTKFFDGRLKELDFENRYKQTEKIEMAFKDTNLYMDKLEVSLLSKQKDTFFFFLNSSHVDIAYNTEFEHFMLVRIQNIDLYMQNALYPLFHCSCGSSNIRRDGANNNGQKRLKCKLCHKTFTVRLNNIISKPYFLKTFINMFNKAVPNYLLVDELVEQMYHDFFHTKFYGYFEELVYNFNLITHMTKYYIMKLFINMQYHRYLIHMTRYINRDSTGKNKEISNIRYFAINKNLDFLKDDTKDIDTSIKSHERHEALVPELFDDSLLLEKAVQDILNLNAKGTLTQ